MKSRFMFVLIFSISTFIAAQVPKTVLLEYATNASCGPCAEANPGSFAYLQSNYGRMVSIWYHAWWPGSGDPMYVANIDENKDRIGYYAVNAVPRYIVDGVLQGFGDEASKMRSQAATRFQLDSPVKLDVTKTILNDSLEVTVTLVVYGAVAQENLKLRTVIIEQILQYNSAPGSNGETEFPHVFRKFIDGVSGIDITDLSIGDSLTFKLKDAISPSWNKEEISIVSFLQSNSSKEVIQAATERKLHSISGEIPSVELVNKNQNINYPFSITNYQNDTLKLSIALDVIENAQNWPVALNYSGTSVDSCLVNIPPQKSAHFELNSSFGENPDYIKLAILAKNIGDKSHFTTTINYLALTKAGDIMLIDDDGGKSFDLNFERALKNKSHEYTKIDHKILSEIKEMFDMPNEYKAILWNIGNNSPSLENSDLSWILSYLNADGRILFSGSGFANDIFNTQRSTVGQFFFRNYLDLNFVSDSVEAKTLSSVPNNPLFDTLNISLNSLYETLPEGVTSRNDESHMIMKFDGTDYYGITLREKNNYKTAYITFGLEQINSDVTQDLVVDKILDWFSAPVVGVNEIIDSKQMPKSYGLDQNFPNPFNPSTIISYQIPVSGNVKIIIHDILGNEVANLVNENKIAGLYSVEFNANNLTSGIYFYSISVNNFYQVKKMLLIK